ncbi:MAG: MgtC/SapB family protein [Clostridia bacterium]|nr:MgtC/SapB family protein [Clostridia bacterium]
MWEWLAYLREFNFASVCVRLLLAVILSGALGIERERHGKAAGLRTHILVCLGAAMAAMTGLYLAEIGDGTADVSRIAAQVVSGIGFLGAGTILVRNKSTVTGLTTAACVWSTGALGLAIGFGFYGASILCALFMLLIAGQLGNLDRKLFRRSREISIYAEFVDAKEINATLSAVKAQGYRIVQIHLTPSRANLPQGIGAEMVIGTDRATHSEDITTMLEKLENVHFAIAT